MRITCRNSAFERVDVKTDVSTQIGALIRPDAIVGSSSSGIPASVFTKSVRHRERFLIVHPVNPPHVVPVVELVPTPWTAPDVVPAARAFMERVGQVPVVVTREIEGFLLNRLQGALLNEAFALLEEGMRPAADIDATVSYGLGLRWSFMGPFETIDLNAPGGLDDYARRLAPLTIPLQIAKRPARLVGIACRQSKFGAPQYSLQKMTCLHGGNGATACSCASSVTFGVAVRPTRDEWSHLPASSTLKRSRRHVLVFRCTDGWRANARDNAEGGA